jgi:hypothetical protein
MAARYSRPSCKFDKFQERIRSPHLTYPARQCHSSLGEDALVYRQQAPFHTDQYAAYTGVMLAEQPKAITQQARKTTYLERFDNTRRQRVSRLVRETLSFSKKLAHQPRCYHILHLLLPSHETVIAAFPYDPRPC